MSNTFYTKTEINQMFNDLGNICNSDIDVDLNQLLNSLKGICNSDIDVDLNQLLNSLKGICNSGIDVDLNFISKGQLYSKCWIIEKLNDLELDLGIVFLCAGWYGLLANSLFHSSIRVEKIRNFDIDEKAVKVSDIINKVYVQDNWKFKAITQDILDIDYSQHKWSVWSNKNQRMSKIIIDIPDTIINTSCEHIQNFSDWYSLIPSGKLVILQSNDYFDDPTHINCCKNIEEFSQQTPMEIVLYEGELELEKYIRFMRIGVK